jgi:hypothetical protein
MNEDDAANLIEIGVDLGVFTLANIFIEGGHLDPDQMQQLADLCSKHIQELTGMPAEDFALKVKPVIDTIIKTARDK